MRERDYAAPLLAPIRRRKVRNRDGPRPRPSWRAVRFAPTDSAPQSADGLSQCKNHGNKARMSMKTKDEAKKVEKSRSRGVERQKARADI